MKELLNSKSYKTFINFEKLNNIPRCSNHEEEVSAFLKNHALNLGLEVQTDEHLNVLIKKPGTGDLANSTPVSLQAHFDMVCEKEADSCHDFLKDPIDMYIDDDYIKARGTTLGADNGLGVAMAMDILESDDILHPPLEVILTATEETGMDGVIGLSDKWLTGKRLINLDTEDEGIMIIGCAGGINAYVEFPARYENIKGLVNKKISISGLKGGHSGLTIGGDQVNAIKLIGMLISKLKSSFNLKVQNLGGGTKHNAIPSEAFVILGIKPEDIKEFENKFEEISDNLISQYLKRESEMKISIEDEKAYDIYLTSDTASHAINLISLLPHGVNTMASSDEDMVESSNNLAIAEIINDRFKVSLSVRSSNLEQKEVLLNKIKVVSEKIGAQVSFSDGYPMWQPNYDSTLAKIAEESYESLKGEKLQVKSIHAGLETGMLAEKYPEMDMISIGPNIFGAHTPKERLSISSTEFTREFLIDILSRL